MKSKVIRKAEASKPYPKLKELSDVVVLFTGEREGIVISSSDERHALGSFYSDWNEEKFEAFDGKIVLTNNEEYECCEDK